jgi:hypothetical protein
MDPKTQRGNFLKTAPTGMIKELSVVSKTALLV